MLLPRFERFKPHTDTDLVYLKSSPDYCEFDVKRGSLGTHGRECDHVSLIFLYIIKSQLLRGGSNLSYTINMILLIIIYIPFREVLALMGANWCAVIEDIRREGKRGLKDVNASFIGVVLCNVRNVCEKWKWAFVNKPNSKSPKKVDLFKKKPWLVLVEY